MQSGEGTLRRWLPSLDQTWCLLALALVSAFIALVPVAPEDFWWHLKVGEIVATRGIPRANLFAWSVPSDAPFVYAAWLADVAMYQAYRLGGLEGPIWLRNLCGSIGFGLVAAEAYRRSGSWRLAGLATLLAGLMTMNNLTARPQNLVWVLMGLFGLLLGAYLAGQVGHRWLLAAIVPLTALWVNIHGSFILVPALLGVAVFGEGVRVLRREVLVARALWLLAALVASLAACLLNPIGPGIFGYVQQILSASPIQQLASEWQPPSPRSVAGFWFFAATLLLLAAWGIGGRRPSLTDVALACALLWLAYGGGRHVVWFGFFAMPMLAQALVPGRTQSVDRSAAVQHRGDPLAAAIAALLIAAMVAVQPPLKPRLPLPAGYNGLFAALPGAPQSYGAETPAVAAAYLREHPSGGRLFADMGYASYLIWAVPSERVFVDPRLELFSQQQWDDYRAIGDGRGAALLKTYAIERVLLSRGKQAALALTLAGDARWEREFAGGGAEIWRRKP